MTEPEQGIILVVEDEEIARRNLAHILTKEGYGVITAESGVKALELIAGQTFDLVITDLKMDRVDGNQVLARTRILQPYTEVIMITGYATVDSAVRAMRDGAYSYIAKPYRIDAVRKMAGEAILKRRLRLENLALKDAAGQIPSIVGRSRAMTDIQKTVRQIAPSDANLLLLGESGTGKELIARAVHRLSPRREKPFLAFNCGSFAEDLMANELFGHEKGAFTGAVQARAGLLESADGGTVFLDEVGDMPVTMQVKLLRVIQEKEFLRVGGVSPVAVDVRFIAATHRDLKEDMEKKLFRQDLYYRLNVITLHLPSLKERDGDIPLLAQHFLVQKVRAMKKDIREINREAMNLLCRYGWPGNVRELENVIERAVALENGTTLTPEDLPDDLRSLSAETYRQNDAAIPSLEEQEKRYIQWVMEKCGGNKTQAARVMGIARVSLWRKLKRYGLETPAS
ncbi:Fis family transcriptional regulator [Desulfonema ishimotonii]|uniref:Fis family transcriptional regulator n=1 Tax=Desulfonema ishimotonii TaxID=45657 RepID=A0A401G1S5_9BACT|nr:sigma-54 dependent transcriptional regulator [Desulfonema ishimotonii]GBC63169.1 Fis family transcriptional regulator [Desulfonema ishimotonii]